MQRHIFSRLFSKNEEIFSMARLLPKRSQLKVPLYIDDGETYKKGGHWKRIKFKQNNQVTDSRDWASMDLGGNLIGKRNHLNIEIKQKDIDEISNFVKNNAYALENLGVGDNFDFTDFQNILIPGGELATEEQKQELKRKVDELLNP